MSDKERTTEEDIARLKVEVDRLAVYLKDPQPHLTMWMIAVGNCLQQLALIREGLPMPDPKAELSQEHLMEVLKVKLSPGEMYSLFVVLDEDANSSFLKNVAIEAQKARPDEFTDWESEESAFEEESC